MNIEVFYLLLLVAISSFGLGWMIALFSGYFEYSTNKIRQRECEHKHFIKYDNYSHTIYDQHLNEKKVCFKFECDKCGIIKYKDIDL